MRQTYLFEEDFEDENRGEAPKTASEGNELPKAKRVTEDPATPDQLMEEILESDNLRDAVRHVQRKKGAPGVDGITVDELPQLLREQWPRIWAQLLDGTYRPTPVKRVEIPKPNGGVRKLGIPTVVDRFLQQAVLQVLQRYWDRTFSKHSFGFRPNKSAHQAIAEAQEYLRQGYRWVVDIDLEKFFDRVNHDKLMGRLAKSISDKRVLKLIRAFLTSGVLEGGLVGATHEGTPQGGPLSPLLSNIVLDELDKELERRGHRFVRYADDCNVYVKSERSGHRVMASLSSFITKKLKLKINGDKSSVCRPWNTQFLGFSFTTKDPHRRRIGDKALERFKKRIRDATRPQRGRSLAQVIEELNIYLRGWIGYFRFCEAASILQRLQSWIHRRLRCFIWRQWKHGRRRYRGLLARGINTLLARLVAGSAQGPWRVSHSRALCIAFPGAFFDSLGLIYLAGYRRR